MLKVLTILVIVMAFVTGVLAEENGLPGGGSTMTVIQQGEMNTVNIAQVGGGTGLIDQNGANNRVQGIDDDLDPLTVQNPIGFFSGTSLTIDQDNENNVAEVNAYGIVTILQNGNDHARAEGGGFLYFNQLADFNFADVINHGGITGVLQMTGGDNEVWLDKQGTDGDVDILQDGTGNKIWGIGGLPAYAIFTGDDDDEDTFDLDVDQIGMNNVLELDANGMVSVLQNGCGNFAEIRQY